ncbi:alpha/beta hydrolase family protein [Luteirhabdus pelagi]|uniref:alpha/beta hydrolase family protein n=1 Tax=Luteirhabdus pelagi TaxID=2792783 RepID=UPI00193999B6|nr:alpha/beta hydrolase [Luteirhabdus pelagi]
MKKTITLILIFVSTSIFAQEIFENEKPISNIDQYNVETIQIETFDYFQSPATKEPIIIKGTLITPKNEYKKVLVIVSGTGEISQNAHNYLTESLLENNIGVFRFDKKGIGMSSGNQNELPQPYIDNVKDIADTLKNNVLLSTKMIGVLGHSLGGIATIGAIDKGAGFDFLIQWSAPIGKPRDIIAYQMKNGITNYNDNIVGKNVEERIQILKFVHQVIDQNIELETWDIWHATLSEKGKKGFKRKQFKNYVTHSFVELAKIDNTQEYKNLKIPTLVIIGANDILVDPIETNKSLKEIDNPKIKFKKFEYLNHFLTKKGTEEKSNSIYDIDTDAKNYIIKWIMSVK